MRFSVVLLVVAWLVAGGASCSEKAPPKADAVAITDPAPQGAAGAKGTSAAPQAAKAAPIPKGAQWTILCREMGGFGHVERARQLRDNLVKTSGLRDWHLLHKEDTSILYYGYYKTYNDPKAKADRAKIDAMSDAQGRRPFRMAHFTPIDAADPGGPPEWNLANAKGYWSLQIAVYKDSPERKQYAVDAVRAARQQGVEAYYYHGENMSLVCVGTWPREAVQTADENIRAGDEGQVKVVLPPLTPDVQKAPELRGEHGRKLHVEAGRNVVVDPTLKRMMEEQYPSMATNGATMVTTRRDPRTGQIVRVADMSFPVKVPREDSTLLDGGIPLPPPPEGAFNDVAPRSGLGSGGGGGSTGLRRSASGS